MGVAWELEEYHDKLYLSAFWLGHHPGQTGVIVSVNDDNADKITAAIADLIEFNDNWKLVFPNVVPDKERGWGAEGYFVQRQQHGIQPVDEQVREQD